MALRRAGPFMVFSLLEYVDFQNLHFLYGESRGKMDEGD
jgi:hypothetical protein